jgi:hypothetical protein
MEVDPEARHILEAEKYVFEVGDGQIIWLEHDDGIIRILQMRHPPGIKCGTNPVMCLASLALSRMEARASTTKSKRRGDNGSP